MSTPSIIFIFLLIFLLFIWEYPPELLLPYRIPARCPQGGVIVRQESDNIPPDPEKTKGVFQVQKLMFKTRMTFPLKENSSAIKKTVNV